MTFKNFYLSEAKQVGELFHNTSIANLLSILKDNTLKGQTYNVPTQHKTEKGTVFGVSMTRSFEAIVDGRDDTKQAKIAIDGDKLSNNYKITPRDEYAYSGSWEPPSSMTRYEKEEFVKGTVKDIKKYIKEIFIDSEAFAKTVKKQGEKLFKYNFVDGNKELYSKAKPLIDATLEKNLDSKHLEALTHIIKKYIESKYRVRVNLI